MWQLDCLTGLVCENIPDEIGPVVYLNAKSVLRVSRIRVVQVLEGGEYVKGYVGAEDCVKCLPVYILSDVNGCPDLRVVRVRSDDS